MCVFLCVCVKTTTVVQKYLQRGESVFFPVLFCFIFVGRQHVTRGARASGAGAKTWLGIPRRKKQNKSKEKKSKLEDVRVVPIYHYCCCRVLAPVGLDACAYTREG